MKKALLLGTIAMSLIISSCDKDDDDDKLNSTDREFVRGVAISNTAEVMAGQLAASKGNTPGVRMFGQMMVTEHTLAQTELKTVGANVGIMVADSVDAEHVALMAYLNSLSGYSFDTAYMNSQVRDHQKTLNIFNMEIDDGQHRTVRDYANKYHHHIEMHRQKADSLRNTL